jgi:predicted DNA-binding transcriptional regulator AlpA
MPATELPDAFHDPFPLLTAEAVAACLSVKPKTLERWRATGAGPRYVRISRKVVRYRRQDVDAFIAERIVANTAQQR